MNDVYYEHNKDIHEEAERKRRREKQPLRFR